MVAPESLPFQITKKCNLFDIIFPQLYDCSLWLLTAMVAYILASSCAKHNFEPRVSHVLLYPCGCIWQWDEVINPNLNCIVSPQNDHIGDPFRSSVCCTLVVDNCIPKQNLIMSIRLFWFYWLLV